MLPGSQEDMARGVRGMSIVKGYFDAEWNSVGTLRDLLPLRSIALAFTNWRWKEFLAVDKGWLSQLNPSNIRPHDCRIVY